MTAEDQLERMAVLQAVLRLAALPEPIKVVENENLLRRALSTFLTSTSPEREAPETIQAQELATSELEAEEQVMAWMRTLTREQRDRISATLRKIHPDATDYLP